MALFHPLGANADSLNNKSLVVYSDLIASQYGGSLQQLSLDLFKNSYIDTNGGRLISYAKNGQKKIIPFNKKVYEPKLVYSVFMRNGSLIYRGAVRATFWNFPFEIRFVGAGDFCKIRVKIGGDMDNEYFFKGYLDEGGDYRKNSYRCSVYRGNVHK